MLNHKNIGFILAGLAFILLVTLIVVKINVDKEGAFLCELVEESPTLTMDECPAHERDSSWLLLVAFGISFLVLGAGLYLIFFPINLEQHDKPLVEIDARMLTEEESKIYDLIKLNQGSMYQSDIIKQMQMTKVKVSRLLDRMEGKGVLERKRRGMTNIIILK